MEKKCRKDQIESAQMLAHSCFNIDTLAFQLGKTKYIGTGLTIVSDLEKIYPNDWQIRARRIGCEVAALQKQFYEDGNHNISEKLLAL